MPRLGLSVHRLAQQRKMVRIEVGLLTGGGDRPYALGLAMSLISKGVCLDFIGSNDLESPVLRASPNLTFLNLRGDQREDASLATKVLRILTYYVRLIRYASIAKPRIFHILWNNRFELFDRTLLILYYRMRGKKIVLTAHNVNMGKRDSNDSLVNRLTLRIQYHLADHIFVHTEAMKRELLESFDVHEGAITVIPLGINSSVPVTDLTPAQARRWLGIGDGEKTILFFGRIGPYKGIEFLIAAFQRIMAEMPDYRLIIAGKSDSGCQKYLDEIQLAIRRKVNSTRIIQRFEFIPDEETELYFKAADVLVLPYTHASQSGILILGYSFGLPVIAADVGSFREDIVEGRTGFLCSPCDPVDLAKTIELYFQSDLFNTLESRRQEIRDYAGERYSWDTVSQMTHTVYRELLEH